MVAKDDESDTAVSSTSPSAQTPFGLNKCVVAGLYFVAITFTGLVVQACDPLQEMLKMNGALSEITNDHKRNSALAKIVGFGIDCAVLSGVIIGPLLEILGTKMGALIGLILHLIGYILMFYLKSEVLYYVASACFGCAFQLILNAHLSIGCLFNKNASLLLTVLSAGPDLSLFVPAYLSEAAKKAGGTPEAVRGLVLKYLLIAAVVTGSIDLLLLPMRPYVPPAKVEAISEETPILEDGEKLDVLDGGKVEESGAAAPADPIKFHWNKTPLQQAMTPEFLMFLPYFVFTFMRKKHYSSFVRSILRETEGAPEGTPIDALQSSHMMTLFNTVVPYGFIPAIAWGAVVSRFGIVFCFFASNVLGVAFTALALLPSLSIQYVTMALYLIHQSFVFGLCLSFCAAFFGFQTLPTLQGVASACAGLISMLVFVWWPDFVSDTLQSFRAASVILTIAGGAAFLCQFGVAFVVTARSRGAATKAK